MKACDLDREDIQPIRAVLEKSCMRLARWSTLFLQANQPAAERRLVEAKAKRAEPIKACGEHVYTFASHIANAYKTQRFMQEWVFGPIQKVVSTILPSTSAVDNNPHH